VETLAMLAYQTTFDPTRLTGQLPINTSLINEDKFKKTLSVITDMFKGGVDVSDLVVIALVRERLTSAVVPRRKIGLATVCSVVISDVLLKIGFPTEYTFWDLLELRNSKPRRFVALIDYASTPLDLSEQFILTRMTSVGEAIRDGQW